MSFTAHVGYVSYLLLVNSDIVILSLSFRNDQSEPTLVYIMHVVYNGCELANLYAARVF